MATVYAKVNDLASAPSQTPTEVAVNAAEVDGVLGSTLSSSPEGGTVVIANMGYAGALATIDDQVYVDTGDGLLSDESRFWPGSGGAEGYANEAKVLKLQGGTSGALAAGTLSLETLPTADDTVTIGTTVYTFVAAPDAVGEVALGADAAAANANLAAAIAGDAFNTAHGAVSAQATAVSVKVTAKQPGVVGNTIATTETLTDLTDAWGAVTLEGGSNSDNYRTSLEPIGQTSDVATVMGL